MDKLLVILGPTATGKTALGINLANKFNGEIVSADSRQLYENMDIGTGKLPNSKEYRKEEGRWIVDGTSIYLYDVITPDKTFSVAEYQQQAYKAIDEIKVKDKLPILVGGTGLYIRAVTEGLKIPKTPPDKNLRKNLENKPKESLLNELEKVDIETYEKIDKQNLRRIVRALEVYHQTGEPLSKLQNKFSPKYNTLKIGLTSNRDFLYEKADTQVERWFKQGFVEETRSLLRKGYKETDTSMTSLGYRQVIQHTKGQLSLDETKQKIKWEQHGYIRRQLTWFRKDPEIYWFDIKDPEFKTKIVKLTTSWLTEGK